MSKPRDYLEPFPDILPQWIPTFFGLPPPSLYVRMSFPLSKSVWLNRCILNKYMYVRLRGRPYIHICRGRIWPCPAHSPSVEGTGIYRQYLPQRADSSDFGLLREQSSPKWDIPCPGRRLTAVRLTAVQNLTPLALSSAEWSATVQTHKQKTKTRMTVFGDDRISSTHVDPTSTREILIWHAITRALPTLNFTSGWVPDWSDFALLGEQRSPKLDRPIPGPGRR